MNSVNRPDTVFSGVIQLYTAEFAECHNNCAARKIELCSHDHHDASANAPDLPAASPCADSSSPYGLSGIRLGLGAAFDKPKSGGSGGMTWLGYQKVR